MELKTNQMSWPASSGPPIYLFVAIDMGRPPEAGDDGQSTDLVVRRPSLSK